MTGGAGPLARVIRPRAARALDDDLAVFERLGWELTDRPAPLQARLTREDAPALDVRLVQEGRFFGGNFAFEATTADPVLPATGGLTARARGLVRMHGLRFRARDPAGRALAAALDEDPVLQRALVDLHFERVFVGPDGRPGIRHLGGSLVWVLMPPIVRATPLVEEQAARLAAALCAFAAVRPSLRAPA